MGGTLSETLGSKGAILVGMVHLPPLPGSPRHAMSMAEVVDRATRDAEVLREAGFDAVMIENMGDAPFARESVDASTVAGMAVVATRLRQVPDIRVGINVLRNDAHAALAIAAVCDAAFIRVNVHTGVYATDQGIIEGQADATLRYRRSLQSQTAILADVHVKHASPIGQTDIAAAAEDAVHRGLADGVIVSGAATGQATEFADIKAVKQSVPDAPVFIGSGARTETVAALLRVCDGAIVGTCLKPDRRIDKPVDPELARAFVQAARG